MNHLTSASRRLQEYLTWIREVALHVFDLFKGILEPLVKVGSLRKDLVDDSDLGSQVVLDQVSDKVAANEANATEDQDRGLWGHAIVFGLLAVGGSDRVE